MFKTINQIAVFVIELIMIGAFAYFGFQKGNSTIIKFLLAIILPVFVVFLWAYFAAPKSLQRLEMPYLVIFRLSLFLIASYLLYKSGQTKVALVVALLSIFTQIASYNLND
jgi:hypothetical protein